MKITKTILLTLLLSVLSFASTQGCELDGGPKVQWRAFKTPAKVGVLGTFTKVTRKTKKNKAKNLKSLLEGQKVEIDSLKMATGNEGRDENIVDNFFKKLEASAIKATIKKVNSNKKLLTLEVILGGVKKSVPMKYDMK